MKKTDSIFNAPLELGDIQMQTDTQMLGEVTVKGQMPTHKMWVILSKTADSTTVQLTMVTSSDLVHNAGWQSINNEVDVDDLFHA